LISHASMLIVSLNYLLLTTYDLRLTTYDLRSLEEFHHPRIYVVICRDDGYFAVFGHF